jgi:hypothetical protein
VVVAARAWVTSTMVSCCCPGSYTWALWGYLAARATAETDQRCCNPAGAARVGPAWVGTARAGTARAGTARAGTARAGTARAGTARAGTQSRRTHRHSGQGRRVQPDPPSPATGFPRVAAPAGSSLRYASPAGSWRAGDVILPLSMSWPAVAARRVVKPGPSPIRQRVGSRLDCRDQGPERYLLSAIY